MHKFKATYSLNGVDIYSVELALESEERDIAAAFDTALEYIEENHDVDIADQELVAISILFVDAVKKNDVQ